MKKILYLAFAVLSCNAYKSTTYIYTNSNNQDTNSPMYESLVSSYENSKINSYVDKVVKYGTDTWWGGQLSKRLYDNNHKFTALSAFANNLTTTQNEIDYADRWNKYYVANDVWWNPFDNIAAWYYQLQENKYRNKLEKLNGIESFIKNAQGFTYSSEKISKSYIDNILTLVK